MSNTTGPGRGHLMAAAGSFSAALLAGIATLAWLLGDNEVSWWMVAMFFVFAISGVIQLVNARRANE